MSALRKRKTLFELVPALGALSAHGGEKAKLVPVDFDHPGILLAEGTYTIGRDPAQSTCVVQSGHVSRRHCEVRVSGEQIWVTDLGSQNGTLVNGEPVSGPRQLKPGDRLGLSNRVTMVLALDEELARPVDRVVEVDDADTVQQQVAAPAGVTDPGPSRSVELSPPEGGAPAAAATIAQLQRQRDVLAILYQISLHCLMERELGDVEQLLTNVLQRLVPQEGGFILYKRVGAWRVAICPGSRRQPSDEVVRGLFSFNLQQQRAVILQDPAQLQALGLGGGAALVAPMIFEEEIAGFLAVYADRSDAYDDEALDIVRQVAKVAAAALRR